ncbi:MAG: double-strand break repair helicase AddA [Fimbriimonadaceae bacterium]|nr:double-strand break repair helicase AddA [Alphaproteobacteria bacterium]
MLHQFPFEANVAAHFEVIDEGTSADLQQAAEREALVTVTKNPHGALATALTTLMAYVGDATFSGLMGAVIGARKEFRDWQRMATGSGGRLDAVLGELAAQMDLKPGDTVDAIEADMLASPVMPKSNWGNIAAKLDEGSKSDQVLAGHLRTALAAASDQAALAAYRNVFLTQTGNPRARLATKKIQEEYPEIPEILEKEQILICRLEEKIKARRTYDATHALLTFADAVLDGYTRRKQQSGKLDYDDLISRMHDLLTRPGAAAWVLYKLDGGIDHILVDEAQDTSPDQWEIIRLLSEEALSGEGARTIRRTIFAVGDEKQSIYSFQGAEPARFDQMRRYFARRVEDAKGKWSNVPLNLSFRSVPAILEAVDQVFARAEARAGLSSTAEPVSHVSFRKGQPGIVEIWPLAKAEPLAEVSPWTAPLDRMDPASPRALLACHIAETIRTWIDTGETIAATGKPIRPGDILILVRRRDALVEALITALRQRKIQVAGADRLILQEHIAVMDLLAAADFVLLPEDDLNLATLLKSPLVGLGEDGLFDLACKRESSLWQALEARRAEAKYSPAHKLLAQWLARADFDTPYAFFAEILGPDKGRINLHRRLGSEAVDAIDEFLNAVLRYEQVQTPSLQGFVHWMRAQSADIKRDMEHETNEVRIMTVHGAKGLEAPIVFLPDTCSVPGARNQPKLTRVAPPAAARHLPDRLIWSPGSAANAPDIVSQAREDYQAAQREEYHRLLYVAMTRARDRLYICGHKSRDSLAEGCWYDLVFEGLRPFSTELTDSDGAVRAWRFTGSVGTDGAAHVMPPAAKHDASITPGLPPWASEAASPVSSPLRHLTPSGGESEGAPTKGKVYPDGNIDARLRGNLIHRLLQDLPSLPTDKRNAAGLRLLHLRSPELDDDSCAFLIREALGVLDMPALNPHFSAAARAEIPLATEVGDPAAEGNHISVSGQIDRLVVLPDRVIVADFKTDRIIPDSAKSVPAKYLNQMAAYVNLVEKIYPQKPVLAQLIWTAGPEIMELPRSLLGGIDWLEA